MLTTIEGGIMVSKHTLSRLVGACIAKPLKSNSTLFDAGVEEQKRKMAELLQREFDIDLGLNPAQQLMRQINDT